MFALVEGHPNIDLMIYYMLRSAILAAKLYYHHHKQVSQIAGDRGVGNLSVGRPSKEQTARFQWVIYLLLPEHASEELWPIRKVFHCRL